MNKYYIVTFQNTHEAMKAEREALRKQIKVVVAPTPTFITKSCGISLKVDEENIMPLKQQQVSYKQYANARFGFSMEYPSTFVTKIN